MIIEKTIDIHVPREYAFSQFTDVEQIFDQLPPYITLKPEGAAEDFSEGSVWLIDAKRSGRKFSFRNTFFTNVAPEHLAFESVSERTQSTVNIELEEIEAELTRTTLRVEMKPKGLLGRVLLQSIKAARSRVDASLERGGLRIAEIIEARYDEANK